MAKTSSSSWIQKSFLLSTRHGGSSGNYNFHAHSMRCLLAITTAVMATVSTASSSSSCSSKSAVGSSNISSLFSSKREDVMNVCKRKNVYQQRQQYHHHCSKTAFVSPPRKVIIPQLLPTFTVNRMTQCESNQQSSLDANSNLEKLDQPVRTLSESHAIFGPLRGPSLIEVYDVYRYKNPLFHPQKDNEECKGKYEVAVAYIQFGNRLNGHKAVVHGGIISLLFDDAMGWGYEVVANNEKNALPNPDDNPIRKAVTANLNIDFRAPLPENTAAVMRIYHNETEGRKVFLSARLESLDGETLYSESSCLYIMLKSDKEKKKEMSG